MKQLILQHKCTSSCDWKEQCHILDLTGNNIGPEGCKYLKDISVYKLITNTYLDVIIKNRTQCIYKTIIESNTFVKDVGNIICEYLDIKELLNK